MNADRTDESILFGEEVVVDEATFGANPVLHLQEDEARHPTSTSKSAPRTYLRRRCEATHVGGPRSLSVAVGQIGTQIPRDISVTSRSHCRNRSEAKKSAERLAAISASWQAPWLTGTSRPTARRGSRRERRSPPCPSSGRVRDPARPRAPRSGGLHVVVWAAWRRARRSLAPSYRGSATVI